MEMHNDLSSQRKSLVKRRNNNLTSTKKKVYEKQPPVEANFTQIKNATDPLLNTCRCTNVP